ncbi:hypothetical protein MUN89_01995 [Halobacillus salinarum]|uniref:Uncharacterized protein n=1 Tax=Halobacillus salinarum TaxID=2932257 RepID=A0ABY4EJV8_9BACI|nr:hypothetical protein [Halobacillus salinarum]UOQ44752.1 hypothetical protein MUN89_01995 [Halobacillus salinarum]
MTVQRTKESSFRGSNRELFYVGYLIILSLLSVQLPFDVKYALIPWLIVLAVDFYLSNTSYKRMKVTAIIVLILLVIFT